MLISASLSSTSSSGTISFCRFNWPTASLFLRFDSTKQIKGESEQHGELSENKSDSGCCNFMLEKKDLISYSN